jgi:CHAD domain-containing protein
MKGFHISRQEPFKYTYRRVILEQIMMAVDLCLRAVEQPDIATHEIRKSTKRIRAVYSLFKEAAGKESYLLGQDHFRRISRLLAPYRLSKAYCDCLSEILLDKRHPVDPMVIGKLMQQLETDHRLLTLEIVEKGHLFNEVIMLLTTEKDRIEKVPLVDFDSGMLANGIKNSYADGRNKLDLMLSQNTTENRHELRKTVKSLWNQLILIRPVWSSMIGLNIHYLDILAEKLGKDHDLSELIHYLNFQGKSTGSTIPMELTDHIDTKRINLQKGITPLAVRLFSEKPGAFRSRMISYYKIYKSDH